MKPTIQFTDSDDLLDIRYDTAFKAVFTRDTPASRGALSSLISTLIERQVTVAAITANEPAMNNVWDRSIRFDIACRTKSGELVDIEMSLNPGFDEQARMEYYLARLFTTQGIKGAGRNYAELKEAYQITILARGRFYDDEELIHNFQYYDPINDVPFGGKSRIITLELAKIEKQIEKPAAEMKGQEAWAAFFHYLTKKDKRGKINEILKKEEGIAMASWAIRELTTEEKEWMEWARAESEFKREMDLQDLRVTAQREGLKEGLEKGLEKGLKKGLQEGRQEGRQEKALEIARNLKTNGVPIKTIADSTGLSTEEIASL